MSFILICTAFAAPSSGPADIHKGGPHEHATGFVYFCEALATKVTLGHEFEAAIDEALAAKGPALLEVMTDAELV